MAIGSVKYRFDRTANATVRSAAAGLAVERTDRVEAMAEVDYVVSCQGVIDDGARSRIDLEFPDGRWTGGGLEPGMPFPSTPQLFQFRIAATGTEDAIDAVREIVEAAGGHVDEFAARPASTQ